MRKIFAFIGLLTTLSISAQVAPNKYFVAFTDKNGTPYSIGNPQAFLTQRAIDRRNAQGIPVVESDLPVNPSYIQQVKNLGVNILNPTKWLNGVSVYAADTNVMASVRALPFVQKVFLCTGTMPGNGLPENKFAIEGKYLAGVSPLPLKSFSGQSSANYGISYTQIHQVKGEALHNAGFRGEGKVIAVLDAGFLNANTLPAFDSLRANNQILGTKDFVLAGNNVYNEFYHGEAVLSVMGGNLPGVLVGTAPKASYWLLRSEDANTEYIIEEYNWVSAAEFADSVGADVINSSLGYTTFDDPKYNHTCADMNGHTTPVTIGANLAASKGIAVINSAGNSGGSSWTCVGAPSDGNQVMAIAAVDSNGFRAPFSSLGSISGGLVKPNIAAMGAQTVVAYPDGTVGRGSGTSYSSPLIAGLTACLWQSKPSVNNFALYYAMERSASQFSNPDSLLGYGIPDFSYALTCLSSGDHPAEIPYSVQPNPFTDMLVLNIRSEFSGPVSLELFNMLGMQVAGSVKLKDENSSKLILSDLGALRSGVYILRIKLGGETYTSRVIKR
jgi:hypothetical protein